MNTKSSDSTEAASLFSDWVANSGNLKIQLCLLAYRTVRWFWVHGRWTRILGLPAFATYRVLVEWVLGLELGWRVQAGPRLRLFHAMGLVIHPASRIGSDCVLRHCTTLGTKVSGGAAPILGNFVDVGCNTVILGGVHLGNGAIVGASSVILKDVPPGAIVAGNPARLLAPRQGD